MATVNERLHELAGLTHAQLDPSGDLLERIRSATVTRRTRPLRSRAALLVAAAVLVVALVASSMSLGRRSATEKQVSAHPVTPDQSFIARGDRACDTIRAAVNTTTIVFPTAAGYMAAATTLIGATQQALAEAGDGVARPDVRPVLTAVDTDLRSALGALGVVQSAAAAGNLSAAQTALDNFTTLTGHAGRALDAYGARHCAP